MLKKTMKFSLLVLLVGCAAELPGESGDESIGGDLSGDDCSECDTRGGARFQGLDGWSYDSQHNHGFSPPSELTMTLDAAQTYCASMAVETPREWPFKVTGWKLPELGDLALSLPFDPGCFAGDYADTEGAFAVASAAVSGDEWVGYSNSCQGFAEAETSVPVDGGEYRVRCIAEIDTEGACFFDGVPQAEGTVVGPYVCDDGKWGRP